MKTNTIKAIVTGDGISTEYLLSNQVNISLLNSQEREIIGKLSSHLNKIKDKEPIPTITNLKLYLSISLEESDLIYLNNKIYELDLVQKTENQINNILSKIPQTKNYNVKY